MSHGEDKVRGVRAAYVFDQIDLPAAAALAAVPEATARRWKIAAKKAGDDWDKARGAQYLAGDGLEAVARQTIAAFAGQVQSTTLALQRDEGLAPEVKAKLMASLADAFTKIMAGSRRLMPETDRLAVAQDVLRRFGDFVAQQKPTLASEFVCLLEPFAEELARAYQ
ncbi:hypothetical protein FACS1894185_3140 [Betaproteobacteria bacterium]|nr:hypothetical protein FACS1894185_3140 [Betaproteobacteria bacterium]